MDKQSLFDHATWGTLDGFIRNLPEPVKIVVWGEANRSLGEREALTLGEKLAERYQIVHFEQRPRRENYHYYPVIGIMGLDGGAEIDYGIRLIGLPAGYQINALVGAIQAASFRGSQLAGRTRIQLSRLPEDVRLDIEVFTSAESEEGPLVATLAAGLAAASPRIRAFLIAVDVFPQAALRYSISTLPHTVVDGRVHIQGIVDEEAMLRQIGRSLK